MSVTSIVIQANSTPTSTIIHNNPSTQILGVTTSIEVKIQISNPESQSQNLQDKTIVQAYPSKEGSDSKEQIEQDFTPPDFFGQKILKTPPQVVPIDRKQSQSESEMNYENLSSQRRSTVAHIENEGEPGHTTNVYTEKKLTIAVTGVYKKESGNVEKGDEGDSKV